MGEYKNRIADKVLERKLKSSGVVVVEEAVDLRERGIKKPILILGYVFPEDILAEIRQDKEAWKNYCNFSEPYRRIRIAYIDAARHRPEEFIKRLDNFIAKTKAHKLITGYGGIEKYYR